MIDGRAHRFPLLAFFGVPALLLAGCGGGGGGGAASPPATMGAAPASPAATAAPAGSGSLSFTIVVPASTVSSAARSVKYVSPSTASVAVTVQGQSTPLATANLSATSPGCSAAASGVTCTVTVTVPAGNDTFLIAAYDGKNGTGHQLSVATVPASVKPNAATTLALTLNGVPASVQVILGATSVPVGNPASVAVTVVAYDANNNVIVGPGTFSTPITLTDSDTSGVTSLSTTSVTAPGTSVTLNYNGNSLASATITPSMPIANGAAATFAPAGYAVTNYTVPSSDSQYINILAPGPDGNVWYGSNGIIGKMSPHGQATEYNLAEDVDALAAGPDGNMWFATNVTEQVEAISPAGNVQTAASYNTGCGNALCGPPNFMVAGPDGNMWFSDANGYIGRTTTSGNVQEWLVGSLPGWPGGSSEPEEISFGSDGKLYAADSFGYVDQIAIAGGAPTGVAQIVNPAACNVYGLTIGPDGNVWFSDNCSNIGTIPLANFSAGAVLEWSLSGLTNNELIGSLASSPGGVWGVDYNSSNLYRIFTSANLSAGNGPAVTVTPAFPYPQAYLYTLCLGPDGNVWTTEDENTPEALAKVIYGGATSGALSATRLSSLASRVQHTAKGRMAAHFRRRSG